MAARVCRGRDGLSGVGDGVVYAHQMRYSGVIVSPLSTSNWNGRGRGHCAESECCCEGHCGQDCCNSHGFSFSGVILHPIGRNRGRVSVRRGVSLCNQDSRRRSPRSPSASINADPSPGTGSDEAIFPHGLSNSREQPGVIEFSVAHHHRLIVARGQVDDIHTGHHRFVQRGHFLAQFDDLVF